MQYACVVPISSSFAELISGLRRIGGARNDRMERGDGGVWRGGTRAEGWKVKLWSEKGRQLVASVCKEYLWQFDWGVSRRWRKIR